MNADKKKLGWLVPVTGMLIAPFTAIPQQLACVIVGAIELIGNESVIGMLAATNALTIIP